jgi:hypothetical protein
MTIVALASVKGSPGVTTTALALASWWPRPVVVMEADPAGGDLAARLGLPEEPGLVGLAASLRRDLRGGTPDGASIERYVQAAPLRTASGEASVVTAPAGSRQAAAAVGLLSGLATLPVPDEADLLLDLGRVADTTDADRPSTAQWLIEAAHLLVWVARPQLADLAHLAAATEHQPDSAPEPWVILTGGGPYPAEEVATALAVTVLGNLPADPSGSAAVWAGGGRTWAHSALGRATRDVATAIAELVGAAPSVGSGGGEPGEAGDAALACIGDSAQPVGVASPEGPS